MAITKQTVVDQITVTENGIILYREATKIIEDGVELTKTYHRSSLTPGQDLTGQPAQVVAIANTVWDTRSHLSISSNAGSTTYRVKCGPNYPTSHSISNMEWDKESI
jgi:hypothetical protein